jgi:hypothetical protein
MFMSEEEMKRFTGYTKHYSQRQFLDRHHISYIPRRDGFPNVVRDHVQRLLGGIENKHENLGPLPDFENINA